jgi:hypothetical protein
MRLERKTHHHIFHEVGEWQFPITLYMNEKISPKCQFCRFSPMKFLIVVKFKFGLKNGNTFHCISIGMQSSFQFPTCILLGRIWCDYFTLKHLSPC